MHFQKSTSGKDVKLPTQSHTTNKMRIEILHLTRQYSSKVAVTSHKKKPCCGVTHLRGAAQERWNGRSSQRLCSILLVALSSNKYKTMGYDLIKSITDFRTYCMITDLQELYNRKNVVMIVLRRDQYCSTLCACRACKKLYHIHR